MSKFGSCFYDWIGEFYATAKQNSSKHFLLLLLFKRVKITQTVPVGVNKCILITDEQWRYASSLQLHNGSTKVFDDKARQIIFK